MPLSAEEEGTMRRWVGTEALIPTSELQAIYDMFGSFDETVMHVLRQRQVDLVSQPSSLSVPGLSITNSTNIAELRELIEAFLDSGGTGLDEDSPLTAYGFGIGVLFRPDPR